ncbi:MAG TPA: type II toxin-antitoxin system VapC family toxin [Solirubrobacteraceae bacterium]|nr:type II toxin-antitoxin system VapC family toxin [Solirubrobacteraceae bacterium]
MKLVIDANVAVAAAANPVGFERFRRFELVAPPLMWIEAVSTLHAMLWRDELRREQTDPMLDRVLAAPVRCHEPDRLAREAWKVADELGWAKTYDANYVALARLLACRLVTLDARMRRGTGRMGFVIGPTELDNR